MTVKVDIEHTACLQCGAGTEEGELRVIRVQSDSIFGVPKLRTVFICSDMQACRGRQEKRAKEKGCGL